MAVLIPLILLFVYFAFLFLRKKKKEREEEILQEQHMLEQRRWALFQIYVWLKNTKQNHNEILSKLCDSRKAQEAAAMKLTAAEQYNSDDEDNNSNVTSTGKETTLY